MAQRKSTLRFTMAMAIVLSTLATVILLIVSSTVMYRLVRDREVDSLSHILELQVARTFDTARVALTDLAVTAQQNDELRAGLAKHDNAAVLRTLDSQFMQNRVTSGDVPLENLAVYTLSFDLVTEAEHEHHIEPRRACESLIAQAAARPGSDKRKVLSDLCIVGDRAHLGVIVPIGGFRPIGYLVAVMDPTDTLQQIEHAVGLPVTVAQMSGETSYRSTSWPVDEQFLTASHIVTSAQDIPMLRVSAAADIGPLQAAILNTTYAIVAATLLILLPAMVFSVFVFNRVGRTLHDLQDGADKLRNGHFERITTQTYPEVMGLVDSFNAMAETITSEIAERKRAELNAEAANNAKSTFLANMSHEIRTPLTAIIGFSEALLDRTLSESERLNSTNTIIRCGKHLLQIINDILDLSKLDAGKLHIEQSTVYLFPILEDIKALAVLQASGKGLAFDIDYEFPLPAVIESDPVRLKQILFNLVNNAIKFTNEGGVRVRVRFDADVEKLFFEIIDTGIGLTPEQQTKLFRAFEQADASTTRQFGGTGLGLHLSQELAIRLGGNIRVESTAGVGSIFTVHIGTGKIDPSRFVNTAPAVDQNARAFDESAKVRGNVLLVDDSKDNQQLISWYLKKMGANVTVADNGLHAVNKALASPFDLILMDMQMPVMDGLEATRILRGKHYRGPIVALTANVLQADTERCRNAGCDEVLGKPVDRQRFRQTVGHYLTLVHGAAAPSSTTPDDAITSSLLVNEPDLADLVQAFVAKIPGYVDELVVLAGQQNWDELGKRLHDFKSTTGNFGFEQLSVVAARALHHIREREHDGVLRDIEEIVGLKARVRCPEDSPHVSANLDT